MHVCVCIHVSLFSGACRLGWAIWPQSPWICLSLPPKCATRCLGWQALYSSPHMLFFLNCHKISESGEVLLHSVSQIFSSRFFPVPIRMTFSYYCINDKWFRISPPPHTHPHTHSAGERSVSPHLSLPICSRFLNEASRLVSKHTDLTKRHP